MALDAGVMSVTVEFAKDLKDTDFFGKQDPYCILRVGGQTFRTRTAVDGGKNPVWHETFRFNIINENDMDIEIKDEDVGKDDLIGSATVSFARARQTGTDRIQAPVIMKKKKNKQHGFVCVSLSWAPNKSPAHPPHPAHAPVPYGAPPYPAAAPGYMAPPLQQYPPQPYAPAPYAPAPYAAPAQAYPGYPLPAGPCYPAAAPPYQAAPGPNGYPHIH